MSMRTLIALVPVLLSLATSLPAAAEDVPLANSSWHLQDTTDEVSRGIPFGMTFFDDETMTVQTNCIDASGTYHLEADGTITIDVEVDDEALAGCDDGETIAFITRLELATSSAVDEDGLLTVTLDDSQSLVFNPALTGVTWEWLEFQSSNGTTTAPGENDVHQVVFSQDGSVSIDTPCANGTGTFRDAADGFDVDLREIDATACGNDSATALLLRDLDMATSYVIRAGQLFIALPMDGGIHHFAPVYETEDVA